MSSLVDRLGTGTSLARRTRRGDYLGCKGYGVSPGAGAKPAIAELAALIALPYCPSPTTLARIPPHPLEP